MGKRVALLNIRRQFFFAIIGIIVPIQSGLADAYPKDFAFRGLYKCHLSGINFARIGIHAEQDAHAYSATSNILSTGVVNIFSKHSSHTTVDGSGKAYEYPRVAYETHYKTKNKPRHVTLEYEAGKFKAQTVEPPENPAKRPPVPLAEKHAAHDPLSGVFRLRAMLIDALDSGESAFSLKVYDGRRLTQLHASVEPESVISLNSRTVAVIPVKLRRTMLAGFTASELKKADPKEPALTVFFSNDTTLFPVRLEVPLLFGLLRADLVKTCLPSESCLLF